jgi:hypothetical protein
MYEAVTVPYCRLRNFDRPLIWAVVWAQGFSAGMMGHFYLGSSMTGHEKKQ